MENFRNCIIYTLFVYLLDVPQRKHYNLGGFQKAGLERFPVVLVGAIGHRKIKKKEKQKTKNKNIENLKRQKTFKHVFAPGP